jgi:3-dehydroquinate synthase
MLKQCNLPVKPAEGMTPLQFRDIMAVDKKVKDGQLRLILLKGPLGSCVVTADFDDSKLEETLQQFCLL